MVIVFVGFAFVEGAYQAWANLAVQIPKPAELPSFRMSDELELDSINHWRVRCWNDGAACELRLRTTRVATEDGKPLIDPQWLPQEMYWTSIPGRPKIGANDKNGLTAAILGHGFQPRVRGGGMRWALFLYGGSTKSWWIGPVSCFRTRPLIIDLELDSEEFPSVPPLKRTYRLQFGPNDPGRHWPKAKPPKPPKSRAWVG